MYTSTPDKNTLEAREDIQILYFAKYNIRKLDKEKNNRRLLFFFC